MINKKPKSLGGKLKKLAVKTFVKTDKIKAQVPAFARSIMVKADNPENKAQLSHLALQKFNDVAHSGFFDSTATAHDSILKRLYPRYHVTNQPALNRTLDHRLADMPPVCIVIVLPCWPVLYWY